MVILTVCAHPDFLITHNPLDYYLDHVGTSTLDFLCSFQASLPQITFAQKLEALACHTSQVDWLKGHDRIDSLHAVEVLGEYRGMQCLCHYAEAFRSSDQRPCAVRRLLP
jgi:N-acetylglucosamine malate deacetylase 1